MQKLKDIPEYPDHDGFIVVRANYEADPVQSEPRGQRIKRPRNPTQNLMHRRNTQLKKRAISKANRKRK